MTTQTAPPAPTIDISVVHAATSFNVAAATPGFGVEILFSRFQDLRTISGQKTPDVLAGASFASVLDAVLECRTRGDRTFDVLAAIAKGKA
ncbi:MAG TPA: hypothetical protein VNH38_02175 [Candidatus Dormibacteraeota bacterium]|nr:hypothetical protein [Candidatus Dormibacteraeota bacterium]